MYAGYAAGGAGGAAEGVQAMLPKMCRRCCRSAGCAAKDVQAMLQKCAGDAAKNVQAMLQKMWLLCLCCQRLDVVVIPWSSRECHCENVYCLMPIVIYSGPFHHNVEFANIVGSAPREMRSAGLC